MRYRVVIVAKAQRRMRDIHAWIDERSPQGADAWADALAAALERLATWPLSCGKAPESEAIGWGQEVRQVLFRTPKGRAYRMLFTIEGDEVLVLQVRGPGEAPVEPDDLSPN